MAGEISIWTGNYEDAEGILSEAIDLGADLDQANLNGPTGGDWIFFNTCLGCTRFYLGNAFSYQGMFEEALTIYMQLVEEEPANLVWLTAKGKAYLNLGQLDDALNAHNRCIQLYESGNHSIPVLEYVFNNHGVALYLHGNPDEALLDYLKAIEINDQYPVPYYNLSIL
ncbi:MAG: tetratricopeptide repeat protein [Anaerolineales bacterium]